MKLAIRIRTAIGTRTIITTGHDPEFAHAVKRALERLASQAMDHDCIYAEVVEDGARVSMKEHMRKFKMVVARREAKAAKADQSNVESLATARSKKRART